MFKTYRVVIFLSPENILGLICRNLFSVISKSLSIFAPRKEPSSMSAISLLRRSLRKILSKKIQLIQKLNKKFFFSKTTQNSYHNYKTFKNPVINRKENIDLFFRKTNWLLMRSLNIFSINLRQDFKCLAIISNF